VTAEADRRHTTALLREEAGRAGFHRFGVVNVGPWPRHEALTRFIADGFAGEMGYLVAGAEARRDPRAVMAEARSLCTVGLSYARPEPDPGAATGGPRAFIARYARGEDYHTVLQRKLRAMAARVAERLGGGVAWTACVDTQPLLEREAAHHGGVGFLARNTMIIAPGLGSYLMLGELLLDRDAEPTAGAEPRCGRCRACLDACPTGAIVEPYRLDARRCISYLTIENPGAIPRELRPLLENMVFGCDRCQEVCPFNAAVDGGAPAGDPQLAPSPRRDRPELVALLGLGAAQFRKLVRGSALRRVHRAQLLRNVAVALGNVGGAGEVAALVAALAEPSALVREHVVWALGRIAARLPGPVAAQVVAALGDLAVREAEPAVREEIALALAVLGPAGKPS